MIRWQRWRGRLGSALHPPLRAVEYSAGARILAYHRVCRLDHDPQQLAVHPERFAAQLDALSSHYNLISLEEIVSRLQRGQTDPSLLAVTFDDGYDDLCDPVLPTLEARRIPATCFITAGMIDSREEFWWDELERLLFHGPIPDDERFLELADGPFDWRAEAGGATPSAQAQNLYRQLCSRLHPLPPEAQRAAIAQIRKRCAAAPAGRPTHRCLDIDGLRRLAASPMITIGAHTVTHPRLASLSGDRQKAEIEGSKRTLERLIEAPVLWFAYPYGYLNAMTFTSLRLVRGAGFHGACANFAGALGPKTDPYLLPRFIVRDQSPQRLIEALEAPAG